jgi:hypothetical protein
MSLFCGALVVLLLFGATTIPWSREQPRAATDIQLSIDQFGKYVDDWSEPEGYFDTDNFISNETSYLHVIDDLRTRVKPGGIYLGVGPDQNFSYIVHTRPMLAIITDIRRQNMLEHLWYKAVFSLAANRAEYLAILTSRQALQLKSDASIEDVVSAVRRAATSEQLLQKNVAAIRHVLIDTYKLKLTPDDLAKIEYVQRTFWEEGLDLRFSSIGRGNALNYPTFEEMLLETDRHGRQQSYLSSEELFQWLKKFESENRLVPIVGDFAGSHALKTVGAFIKANGLHVSAFYTSNVEFYLFGQPAWARYVSNVKSLPINSDSLFVRSYFPNGRTHPLNVAGHRSTSLTGSIARFVQDYDARRLESYWDVVKP